MVRVLEHEPVNLILSLDLGESLPEQRVVGILFSTKSRETSVVLIALVVRATGTRCIVCIDRTAYPSHSVRIGGTSDLFLMHVSDRPALDDTEMGWQIRTSKVTPSIRTVASRPSCYSSIVPGIKIRNPIVGTSRHALITVSK